MFYMHFLQLYHPKNFSGLPQPLFPPNFDVGAISAEQVHGSVSCLDAMFPEPQ